MLQECNSKTFLKREKVNETDICQLPIRVINFSIQYSVQLLVLGAKLTLKWLQIDRD